MKTTITPQDQVFWYLKRSRVEPLRSNIQADVAIIGGMPGLTAAQPFRFYSTVATVAHLLVL